MMPINSGDNKTGKKKPAVIIDVDNTIFDQSKRKTVIIQDKLDQRAISLDQVRSDFSLKGVMRMLSDDMQRAFWEAFFGLGHYRNDQGYTIEIYPHCAKVINDLSINYRIIYLTGRPDIRGQREELIRQLKDFGCPAPNGDNCELYLMPNGGNLDSNEAFKKKAIEFKNVIVKELTTEKAVSFGIGDTEDDITAYKASGVYALQFLPPGSSNEKFFKSDLALKEWTDLGETISLIDSESKSELIGLREMHIKEYGGWLSDLDAKSRLLLVINTVLFSVSLTLLAVADGALDYVFYASSVISLLAMAFCIRSFSSRRIRGTKAGRNVSLGWLSQMITCLIGGKPVPLNTPIHKDVILKGSDQQTQKIAHIQFFMDNYGTLDPAVVKNLRLFELRALNYVKIFGEIWGRRFTFLGMLVIGIGVTISVFGKAPEVSLQIDDKADQTIQRSIENTERQAEITHDSKKPDRDGKGNDPE